MTDLRGAHVEEMPAPGVERDVEAVAEVVSAPFVHLAARRVGEHPAPAAQLVPRQGDVADSRRVTEVHDDELARAVAVPAPDEQVLPRVVPLPAAALAELPGRPCERRRRASAVEQSLVERAQFRVGLLVGPAPEEDRQLDAPTLELALVDEPRARLRQRRDRRRPRLRRAGTPPPRAARRGSR